MLSTILHPHQVAGAIDRTIVVRHITTDNKKFFIAVMLMWNRGVTGFHLIEVKTGSQRSVAVVLKGQAIGDTLLVDESFELDFVKIRHAPFTCSYRLHSFVVFSHKSLIIFQLSDFAPKG